MGTPYALGVSSSRPPATSAVRARRRAAYLDAAEGLLAGGQRYAGVAIADIAEAAGFSRASFYAYFADKRELATAVAERFRAELVAAVGGWLRGEDAITLAQAMGRAIATFEARRGAVLLLAEASAYDDEIAAIWRAVHAEFETLVLRRIELGDADGHLAPDRRAALAYVLVWGTQGVIVEHLRAGRPTARALEAALETLWAGVLLTPAGRT